MGMESLSESLLRAAAAVAALGSAAADFAGLPGPELRTAALMSAALRQCSDRYAAMIAAEMAHQSNWELGHSGLAAAAGFASTVQMVQATQGVSHRDAVKLIEVGTLIAQTEAAAQAVEAPTAEGLAAARDSQLAASTSPADSATSLWQQPLIAALNSGALSIDGADVIRRALGEIDTAVTAGQLAAAAEELIAASAGLTPEALSRRARQLRDQLDEDGIARREKARDDLRSVRMWTDAAGMHCGSWRLAPEDGLIVASALDAILSPRRGGPRFVHTHAVKAAEELLADPRTREQIAADGLVGLIRLAVDADPTVMHGSRRPAVRVLVTSAHLSARAGHGRLEGTPTRYRSPPSTDTSATPEQSPSASTTTDNASTSAATNDSSPSGNASAWPPATEAAWPPAATDPRHGAKHTTSTNGPETTVTPTSPTASCSAEDTTSSSTTTDGKSTATTPPTTSHHPETLTRNRNQYDSSAATPTCTTETARSHANSRDPHGDSPAVALGWLSDTIHR